MNNPNQIRALYKLLKISNSGSYKDYQLLEFANQLHEIFNDEVDQGWEDNSYYEERSIRDVYSLMSGSDNDMMYQERELLSQVYDYETDDFIRDKPWNSSSGRYA
jgi:hypothetical protein